MTAREDQPRCTYANCGFPERDLIHDPTVSGPEPYHKFRATEAQPHPTCAHECGTESFHLICKCVKCGEFWRSNPEAGTIHERAEAQGEAHQENICGTATNAAISMSEGSRPIANSACPSEGLLLPDEEWSHLSQESRDKISKWFRLAVERLQLILDADPARVETGAHPSQDAPPCESYWLVEWRFPPKEGREFAWQAVDRTPFLTEQSANTYPMRKGYYEYRISEFVRRGARSTPSLPTKEK